MLHVQLHHFHAIHICLHYGMDSVEILRQRDIILEYRHAVGQFPVLIVENRRLQLYLSLV